MNNQTNSTSQLTDEQMARQLQMEINRNSRRSDTARAAPERYGKRATSSEVREALKDGQGTSQNHIWVTKRNTRRKY